MNNLKQTIRLVIKNRKTTILLMFSLSFGLISYILLSAKVSYNKSYDTYLDNYENTYRIISSSYTNNVLNITQPLTQRGTAELLKSNYPAVTGAGYICRTLDNHYSIDDNPIIIDNGFHCSAGFLDIFDIEITNGKADKLLSGPGKVIVSETFANRYAGDEDPLGKIIYQYPGHEFEIEAVFKDFPRNSHLHPDLLISFHDNMRLPPPLKDNWGEFSFYTYIVLDSKADIKKIEEGITQLCRDNNSTLKSGSEYKFRLQSIEDIHTKSNLKNEISQNVNGGYLSILQLISILILIVSGFNYIYFSYIRISNSSAQFGVRKALGAGRRSLFYQFLSESLTFHLAALVLSVLLIDLLKLLPANFYTPVRFADLQVRFWYVLFMVLSASSILNPLIIMIMLSGRTTLSLLTKNNTTKTRAFSFRQIFTVLQFAIIIFLISSIIGISKQLSFLESKSKGIDISNKLVIKTPVNLTGNSVRVNNLLSFEQELIKIPGVDDISVSNSVPGDIPSFDYNVSELEETKGVKTSLLVTDKNFIDLYMIRLTAGSGFLTNEDNSGCVINESCMKHLGFKIPADALGRKLYIKDESGLQTVETYVIGICQDFNFSTIKDTPAPAVLINFTNNRTWGNYTLSINPNIDNKSLLSKVEKNFSETFPGYSFEYFWLKDYYYQQFAEENTIISNLRRFAIVAILLGILSLLSMGWHESLARTKEIGIRKVNGAKPTCIIRLLNLNFSRWIGISALIAIPFSWYFLSVWLKTFAYKAPVSIWTFIFSAGLAFIIGLTAVTLQSLKVANMNPVESIRNE